MFKNENENCTTIMIFSFHVCFVSFFTFLSRKCNDRTGKKVFDTTGYKTQKLGLLWIHQRLIHLFQNRSQNNGGQS